MRQAGLFGLSEHRKRLSAHGDPLEELVGIINFEVFRPTLVAACKVDDLAGHRVHGFIASRGELHRALSVLISLMRNGNFSMM
jgi:hypothetical protein